MKGFFGMFKQQLPLRISTSCLDLLVEGAAFLAAKLHEIFN
jgi:hypothetical protein